MKLACITLLISLAAGWQASAQTWDTSGNSMLNGTYYFRETAFFSDTYYDGGLSEATAFYGNITFHGNGTYTVTSGLAFDSSVGQQQTIPATTTGTYAISASGYGYISSLFSSTSATYYIYGLVSQNGIFVGSATESYTIFSSPHRSARARRRRLRSRVATRSRTWTFRQALLHTPSAPCSSGIPMARATFPLSRFPPTSEGMALPPPRNP